MAVAEYRMQSANGGRVGVGSATPRAAITTWRWGRSYRRCSIPPTTFNAWYGKDGPQNYSFWDNKEFQALSAQIDREIDVEKRQELIRRAEMMTEQDPPMLPVAWERIHELWYNYVKGRHARDAFGIYDTVRHDTVWLDKA